MNKKRKFLKVIFAIVMTVGLIITNQVFAWSDPSLMAAPVENSVNIKFYVGGVEKNSLSLTVNEEVTVEAKINFNLSTPNNDQDDVMPTVVKISSTNQNLTITPSENELSSNIHGTGENQEMTLTQVFKVKATANVENATIKFLADINNEDIGYGSGNGDGAFTANLTVSTVEETSSVEEKTEDTTTTKETTETKEEAKEEVKNITYAVLEGADQKYDATGNERLRFRFDIPYDKFLASGKVYVDDVLTSSENYNSEEGSTVIIFTKAYTDLLKAGNHTVKVTVDDGEASANFTVTKAVKNPQTNDNIIVYVTTAIISLIGITCISLKKRFN